MKEKEFAYFVPHKGAGTRNLTLDWLEGSLAPFIFTVVLTVACCCGVLGFKILHT